MAMPSSEIRQPLVRATTASQKLPSFWRTAVQWTLLVLMGAIGLLYGVALCTIPTKLGKNLWNGVVDVGATTLFGKAGVFVVLYSAPWLAVALLGVLYLATQKTVYRGRKADATSLSLWTHPVIVDGPLGVVSAAELIIIVLFLCYFIWALINFMVVDFEAAQAYASVGQRFMKLVGLRLGFLGLICMNLLFLPVARGSVLLRLLDIPFEHAVKYHVWMGNFMMTVFTVHGLTFVVLWIWRGNLLTQVTTWKPYDIANVPGILAYIVGLIMWVTSLGVVRKSNFELFYYTHHLYVLFVICLALHVGDYIFSIAIGALLLFTLDRLLRFCQSQTQVRVLSAKVLGCGTLELILAKPPNLKYGPLSFLFLYAPSISWLEWHPFSVSSSPYDGDKHISFLVKPMGEWTKKLRDRITADVNTSSNTGSGSCPFKFHAAVEGPYGNESSYFLRYDSLVLIAGGIGVSPFVAILRDLLHRYARKEADLPVAVILIWAVKKVSEINVLDLVSPHSICPQFASQVTVDVQVFVTQEAQPDVEFSADSPFPCASAKSVSCLTCDDPAVPSRKSTSALNTTTSNFWSGVVLASSILGYVVVEGLANALYIWPVDRGSYKVVVWSVRGLIALFSLVLGVVLFGGCTIALWHAFSGQLQNKDLPNPKGESVAQQAEELALGCEQRLLRPLDVRYGSRPRFDDLFEGFAKSLAGSSIGVLVCGPSGMQKDVATQCRHYNSTRNRRPAERVIFNYHSVSFDL